MIQRRAAGVGPTSTSQPSRPSGVVATNPRQPPPQQQQQQQRPQWKHTSGGYGCCSSTCCRTTLLLAALFVLTTHLGIVSVVVGGRMQEAAQDLSNDDFNNNDLRDDHAAAAAASSSSSPQRSLFSSSSSLPPCAILLFGLPRAFASVVLPTMEQNIVAVNAAYGCDYFVHYYRDTSEPPSRSGYGHDSLNPDEIYRLTETVERHGTTTTTTKTKSSSRVFYTSDTNATFWQSHGDLLHRIRTTTGPRKFVHEHPLGTNLLYLPVKDSTYNFHTTDNVVKMWHSIHQAWNLMLQQQQQQQQPSPQNNNNNNNNNSSSDQYYYQRIAVLRSDVAYLTPIDIWQRPRSAAPVTTSSSISTSTSTSTGTDGGGVGSTLLSARAFNNNNNNTTTASRMLAEYYTPDYENVFVTIPGSFALYPVNDRMILGPAAAVEIWAHQRFAMLDQHVHKTILREEPGFGMHSERFVAYSLLPRIQQLGKLQQQQQAQQQAGSSRPNGYWRLVLDLQVCFVRVRGDASVWINDCASRRSSDAGVLHRLGLSVDVAQLILVSPRLANRQASLENLLQRPCSRPRRLPAHIHTRVWYVQCDDNNTNNTNTIAAATDRARSELQENIQYGSRNAEE